jgi:hypothetical protein
VTCILSPLIAGAGTSCQSCPAGTFASRNASSSCTICTGDQPYSQPDRAACSSFCPLGFEVSLLDKNCVPCSAGKFSGDYLTACLTCQAGTYSDSVNGSTACVSYCAPGTHSVESNVCPSNEKCGAFCTKCDPGTYSVGGKAACTFCSAGTNSLSGATACTACAPARLGVCSYCEAGFFPKLRGSDFLTCAACDTGKYFSMYGSTYCADCAGGKFIDFTNATVCKDCRSKCPGPSFFKSKVCMAKKDLICEQFQQDLSLRSKFALLFAPVGVFVVLLLLVQCLSMKYIPKVLLPIRRGSDSKETFREAFQKSNILDPNSANSISAALLTILVASLDFLSNVMLLLLLFPNGPDGIYEVQCTSIVLTLFFDCIACWMNGSKDKKVLAKVSEFLGRVWLYILECQELDNNIQGKKAGADSADQIEYTFKIPFTTIERTFHFKPDTCVKLLKVIKIATNSVLSYYVQVNLCL